MIPFPGSKLNGVVHSVISIRNDRYRSLVILKDVIDEGWSTHKKGVVRTTIPAEKLGIQSGDRVSCKAFEDLGSTQVENEYLPSWEMTTNFQKH
jgi:hypothetical protein